MGIDIERYQTATPPRIDKNTIDFSELKKLYEEQPRYFSIFTKKEKNQYPTYLADISLPDKPYILLEK